MSIKNTKKNLIHFARREYREKRPLSVQALKINLNFHHNFLRNQKIKSELIMQLFLIIHLI